MLSNGIGNNINDLVYNYTINQIYLFFEKVKKQEMDRDKMDAIILSNALVYASPSYSTADNQKKRVMWKKFMDSLDWETLQQKSKKKTTREVKNVFGALGIPVQNIRKKKGDK